MSLIALVMFSATAAFAQGTAPPSPPNPGVSAPPGTTAVTGCVETVETLARRVAVLEKKGPPPWFVPLLSTLFGAALGLVITLTVTRKADSRADQLRRTDSAIGVMSEWIKMSPDVQYVNRYLEAPGELREKRNLNAVLEYGNWLEVTAARLAHDLVDRGLLEKVGLLERMRSFLNSCEAAAATLEQSKFEVDLRKYLSAWTSLTSEVGKWNEVQHGKR